MPKKLSLPSTRPQHVLYQLSGETQAPWPSAMPKRPPQAVQPQLAAGASALHPSAKAWPEPCAVESGSFSLPVAACFLLQFRPLLAQGVGGAFAAFRPGGMSSCPFPAEAGSASLAGLVERIKRFPHQRNSAPAPERRGFTQETAS